MTAIFKNVPKRILPLFIFFLIAPFVLGIYYDFTACIASLFLFIYFVFLLNKSKSIKFIFNLSAVAAVIPLCYLICSIWAVDSGMTLTGFVKFLPLLPFSLIIMQLDEKERKYILRTIPIGAVVMTATSYLLGLIPYFYSTFYTDRRLSGFFQYPNTFSLYLLLGFILICMVKEMKLVHWISVAILLFGIFESGSRTVFMLLFISVIALFIIKKDKKFRIYIALIFGLLFVISFLYIGFTADYSSFGRLWTTSLNPSTLFARLLYYKDALGQVLRHPFGTGYMGYYYTLRQFQTGNYSLMFVHNDIMQLMLDIGWIPALALLAAVIRSVIKAKTAAKRLLLCVFSVHILLDFDLQYIFIFLVLICLLDYSGKVFTIGQDKALLHSICFVFCAVSIYFGTARLAGYMGNYGLSLGMLSSQTDLKTELLVASDDLNYRNTLADSIITDNSNVSVAYSAKALYAFAQGDFAAVINYKEKVLELAPYDNDEYNNYCKMLIVGISMYEQNNDEYSAQYCREALLSVANRAGALPKRNSNLAMRAGLDGQVKLSDSILAYVAEIEN